MTKITKNKIKGVTLIELLVAVAIFVIIVTAAIGLYVSIIKSQQRTRAMQDVQQDARYAMEAMAREFRMGEIDYEFYDDEDGDDEGVQTPENELAIEDKDGKQLLFKIDNDTDKSLCVQKEGSPTCDKITASGVKISKLSFYLHPTNPATSNDHQRVTIVMTAKTTGGSKEKQASIDLQTTVSSRVYKP